MMESSYKIRENIKRIQSEIENAAIKANRNPLDIKLMAVTKTRTVEEVNAAIDGGVTLLGESKVQEFLQRFEGYDPCEVHFIGHLQSNKVKQLLGKALLIHSVDSLKLAEVISKQSEKENIVSNILIEVNIGQEASKSGTSVLELNNLLDEISQLQNIKVKGLMCIPPFCEEDESEKYFFNMQKLFVDISQKKRDNISMEVLSMGMSSDFNAAIKHGSNIVRIGSAIFGDRYYG